MGVFCSAIPLLAFFGWYYRFNILLWICIANAAVLLSLYFDHHQHAQFEKQFFNKPIHLTGYVQDVEIKNGIKTITLITTQIHNSQAYTHHPYKILIHIRHKTQFIPLHDILEISPVTFFTPNTSGYDRYLKKEGIFASAYIPTQTELHILSHASYTPSSIERLSNKMRYFPSLLFKALFYGKKPTHTAFSNLKQYFNYWGIGHYLARSGLHVTLLFILLLFLLGYIPLPWYIKQGILFGALILLYISTVSSTSFIRACIFYILASICNILKIPFHPLHILNLTLLGMIIYNPYLIGFLDFQLTFSATYILMWLGYLRAFTPNS